MVMRKYAAEAFGSGVLVFVGCGAVTIGAFGQALPSGAVPIGLAFGLTLSALIYAIGPISGCHINPAVTISMWAAGRLKADQVPGYIAAQLIGATVGAGALLLILNGTASGAYDVATRGLGQNGWGENYLGAYNLFTAFFTEFVMTAVFITVILGASSTNAVQSQAGLAIGATLAVIIIGFLNVTGVSLNPARSLGPALFVGGKAISQLWLFFVAPSLAGLLIGLFFRYEEKQKHNS